MRRSNERHITPVAVDVAVAPVVQGIELANVRRSIGQRVAVSRSDALRICDGAGIQRVLIFTSPKLCWIQGIVCGVMRLIGDDALIEAEAVVDPIALAVIDIKGNGYGRGLSKTEVKKIHLVSIAQQSGSGRRCGDLIPPGACAPAPVGDIVNLNGIGVIKSAYRSGAVLLWVLANAPLPV